MEQMKAIVVEKENRQFQVPSDTSLLMSLNPHFEVSKETIDNLGKDQMIPKLWLTKVKS